MRRSTARASSTTARGRTNPDELFVHLLAVTGLAPPGRLLEVGSGTGKATLPLARRGFRLTCIELGANLAAVARRHLGTFADVDVIEDSFEHWPVRERGPFDLVFAATAWHWIDPTLRQRKAWEVLRPGGHLAFWSAAHVFPADGDRFFMEIQFTKPCACSGGCSLGSRMRLG